MKKWFEREREEGSARVKRARKGNKNEYDQSRLYTCREMPKYPLLYTNDVC